VAKGKKRKGNCPRCGARMKLAQRFCNSCGSGNPLLVRRVPARRQAAKAAGSGYAPVVPLLTGVPGRDPRWTEILANPDPDARDRLFKAHFPYVVKGDPE
jgi:hypothetical protein